MESHSKKTLLHGWHTAHGANMADFGGYEMPLWYASAKNEHLAVLTHAGAFDTSHMASLLVSGEGAFGLLQQCFTNDLAACMGRDKKALFQGRCVYGAFLNERGEVIDDAIVFHLAAHEYMVVVNAGMGAPVAAHLKAHAGGEDVRIIDLTDRLGKMDVQGPMAARVVRKILKSPETVFDQMPYFSFKGHFDQASPLCRRGPAYGRNPHPALPDRLHRRVRVRDLHRPRTVSSALGEGDPGRRGIRAHGLRTGGPGLPARRRRAAFVPPGYRPLALCQHPLVLCPPLRCLWQGVHQILHRRQGLGRRRESGIHLSLRRLRPQEGHAFRRRFWMPTARKSARSLPAPRTWASAAIRTGFTASPARTSRRACQIKGLCCGFVKVKTALAPAPRSTSRTPVGRLRSASRRTSGPTAPPGNP